MPSCSASQVFTKDILKNANVTRIEGRGKVVDPHTVDVDGKLYSAKNILISVGGRPFIPDISGSEYAIDSDAALDLPMKPNKIAINLGLGSRTSVPSIWVVGDIADRINLTPVALMEGALAKIIFAD
ncbi:hypothetical protein RND71_034968 [Anisodus tanguticus]|uniref:FAD/NAD(P)-binding domain-containing protein n=1 Tax=Anisodus tanguticus TaxID=243964 RepID=A0AAE1R6S2_9SOLA|nr:hypothetical protein RND71_034968 [Anisodus tanguticus]